MESQWYELRQALNSRTWVCEELKNQFFQRLLVVLGDPESGPADQTKAYYDALASAHALHVHAPSLPLVDPFLRNGLASAGLDVHPLTGEVQLDKEEFPLLDMDVYALQRRRFLIKPPMDPALLAKLPGGEFSTYNGRGQQTATRIALTSPDDATLFVNLPTGCGKTLLIHALMLMAPSYRLTLVIVPTVGLALEQGERAAEILKATGEHHGGPYVWIGGQNQEVRTALRERLKSGSQRILFCAPEAARTSLLPILFRLAKQEQLGAIVVDEAHLIDQWGAGFRPDFQIIPPLVQSLQGEAPRGIKTVLMSATLSLTTLTILKSIFSAPDQEPIEVNANFLRPEPSYYLTRTQSVQEHQQLVLTQLRRMPRPLILYTTEPDDAEELYALLVQQGYSRIGLFHGRTGNAERERLINQWRKDQLDIMVATSAFGVGMDKGDVRSVLHAVVPENIDRYYQ
ncbi:MAG: DEAD/DEAH box helicase, partial [Desulfofustis sp.]|nr:DEAD/DEAH box helicase [Desulfofustis sp.]